ncbi:MAG: BTAD domain-containing putative transcriptional regulator [Caldilineaceae bacterium]
MAQLSLHLLGAFHAQLDDQPLTGFQSDKARALLAYLALEADRVHSRAQLAGLFWPDLSEQRARAYLRHAVANLRKILGDNAHPQPFLLVTRATLQWNPQAQTTVDALLIEQRLATPQSPFDQNAATQWEAMITGYTAPLLAGFYVNDCPEVEEWLLLRRERLHRLVVMALHQLTTYYTGRHAYRQAIQWAQRLVELDPWREEAHRQLMDLLAQDGQRSAALAQYEQCRHLLATELGVTPGAETQTLYHAILVGTHAPRVAGPQSGQNHKMAVDPASHDEQGQTMPLSPTNLPAALTLLIGRTTDIQAIHQLVVAESVRLVTLTGPGGVGKTRLGIAAAAGLNNRFPNGVYLVELAALREAELVITAIAKVLQVHKRSNRPLLEQVQASIASARLLLLIDNFEHLQTAAATVASLLAACPRLCIMVTSRERLRLRGEYEYVVPPLTVPQDDAAVLPAELEQFSALQLFRQHALAANQHFRMDQPTVTAISQLCRRLDGLPLALELAAAHSRLYSPHALLQRFEQAVNGAALHLLKAEKRDAPQRHHSLWQTIAWSYDLLDEKERLLFRRLAVFGGRWTVAAVESLFPAANAHQQDIATALLSLVDKNLVHLPTPTDSEPRFAMLETIREFAQAALAASGEAATIQARHALYYLGVAEEADRHIRGPEQDQWLTLLDREHDNLRTALTWTTQSGKTEIGLPIVAALFRYWVRRGLEGEGFMRTKALLASYDSLEPSAALGTTLFAAGLMGAYQIPIAEQMAYFARCVEVCHATGNEFRLSYALGLMGNLAYQQGDYANADRLNQESLAVAHKMGDRWGVAVQLGHNGNFLAMRGNFTTGRPLTEQSVAILRELGDKWGLTIALSCLGNIARLEGNYTEARTHFEESLRLNQLLDDQPSVNWMQVNLALVALDMGEVDHAAALLQQQIPTLDELNGERQATLVSAFACLAVVCEQPACALQLAAAEAAIRIKEGIVLPPIFQTRLEEVWALARQKISPEAAANAWAKGAAMTIKDLTARLGDVLQSLISNL